jgi:glutaredoxin
MLTLFSTGCPKCRVLEQKLNKQNIAFEICDDMQEVIDKGFMSAPVLKLGDDYMDFVTAVTWLNEEAAMKSECDSCQI